TLARAVEPEEDAPVGGRCPLPERRYGAHGSTARRLHQDDVRAEPGKELSRERPRLVREIEDAEPREDAGRGLRAARWMRHSRRKRSRAASSVSADTAVTRSEISASVPAELGPTSTSTE